MAQRLKSSLLEYGDKGSLVSLFLMMELATPSDDGRHQRAASTSHDMSSGGRSPPDSSRVARPSPRLVTVNVIVQVEEDRLGTTRSFGWRVLEEVSTRPCGLQIIWFPVSPGLSQRVNS